METQVQLGHAIPLPEIGLIVAYSKSKVIFVTRECLKLKWGGGFEGIVHRTKLGVGVGRIKLGKKIKKFNFDY